MLQSSEGRCSAEVLYPRGEMQHPPQVQLSCDGLPRLNTSDKEQAFYQQYFANSNPVTATYIPGITSYSSATYAKTRSHKQNCTVVLIQTRTVCILIECLGFLSDGIYGSFGQVLWHLWGSTVNSNVGLKLPVTITAVANNGRVLRSDLLAFWF